MGKPEPISKVVMSIAMRVIWGLEPKLVQEDVLIDAICTLNNTFIFYNSTKLPELGFPSVDTLYIWYLKKKITFIKDALHIVQINPPYCAGNKVVADIQY